jgi:hypothetical protein
MPTPISFNFVVIRHQLTGEPKLADEVWRGKNRLHEQRPGNDPAAIQQRPAGRDPGSPPRRAAFQTHATFTIKASRR